MLAASAPWLGALLNVLPGLGTGYVYQRRWRAWWITSLLAIGWSAVALALGPEGEGAPAAQIVPAGLLALSLTTAAEAFLAARKARHD